MRFLLDTNVVSEARKPNCDPNVAAWLSRQSFDELAISVLTILEIDIGIRRLRRRDPASADVLQHWFDEKVLTGFNGRILPLDLACVRAVAPMHVPDPRPERDAMIAATALVQGLKVVTRNVSDFAPLGVATLNPWQSTH